jgi:hypothetical protein
MEHNTKRNIIRAIEIILVFGVALLVLLYALGYYDLTFIDREKLFGSTSGVGMPGITAPADDPAESESETDSAKAPDAVKPATNTSLVFDAAELPSDAVTAGALPSGYYVADEDFVFEPGSSKLVKLDIEALMPKVYSNHTRIKPTPSIIYPEDDSEKLVVYTDAKIDVPAVEVYMGYVMITYGDGYTYIFSSEGDALCKIPEGKYTPAYTRDTEGRALFVRDDLEGYKIYFYITDDGANFMMSDYDDEADGRGLYFDYPASYGAQIGEDVAYTRYYDEKSKAWGYKNQWGGSLTNYDFTSAYAFSEGLAAVTTRDNRSGLYFITTHGYRPFVTWRTFLNEHGRYVIENYLPPLTSGFESIGSLYFDEGLVRVRHQVIDYWNWDAYRRVRVVSDEDILVRPDGSRYDMPAGFTLEGYSNGVLTLSKDGKYGFMHAGGEWIAQPIYKSATAFVGGIGILECEDGRVGAIDTDGNIVLPFAYSHISQVSDGVIAAYREVEGEGVWELYRIAAQEEIDNGGDLFEVID